MVNSQGKQDVSIKKGEEEKIKILYDWISDIMYKRMDLINDDSVKTFMIKFDMKSMRDKGIFDKSMSLKDMESIAESIVFHLEDDGYKWLSASKIAKSNGSSTIIKNSFKKETKNKDKFIKVIIIFEYSLFDVTDIEF